MKEIETNNQTQRDDIAVIVPAYMGAEVLRELSTRLIATLQPITSKFSIVLVDDRALDNVWPIIVDLCASEPRIKGFS